MKICCIFGNNFLVSKSNEPPGYSETRTFLPQFEGDIHVIKVYDGDTITIATRVRGHGNEWYRFQVRLQGIDCPEMKTTNVIEKKIAMIARDFVSSKVLNKIITLSNIQYEKYGRLLADVFIDGESLSESLLIARLAVRYSGKTKNAPSDWEEYYNGNLSVDV